MALHDEWHLALVDEFRADELDDQGGFTPTTAPGQPTMPAPDCSHAVRIGLCQWGCK
jgi:hypothetical protein